MSRRRLAHDTHLLGQHATDLQRAKILQRSTALKKRITGWYNVQQLYTPQARIIREREERHMADDAPAVPAAEMPLYLPSSLSHRSSCPQYLHEFEFQLRYAQAHDSLNSLRNLLSLRSHLWKHKNRFARGQGANTRMRTLIDSCGSRIQLITLRYRAAHRALCSLAKILGKIGWDGQLQTLADEDIREMAEDIRDMDPKARKKPPRKKEQARDTNDTEDASVRGANRKGERPSEGRKRLSWIWMVSGVSCTGTERDRDGESALFFELDYSLITPTGSFARRVVPSTSPLYALVRGGAVAARRNASRACIHAVEAQVLGATREHPGSGIFSSSGRSHCIRLPTGRHVSSNIRPFCS